MLIVVAVLAALVAEFWWILVPLSIVTVTFVLVRRGVRAERQAAAIRSWLAAELRWRADQHLAWVIDGDPRALYGIYPPADLAAKPKATGHRGPAPVSPEARCRRDANDIRRERTRRERQRAQDRGVEIHQHGSSTAVRVFTAGADISVEITH